MDLRKHESPRLDKVTVQTNLKGLNRIPGNAFDRAKHGDWDAAEKVLAAAVKDERMAGIAERHRPGSCRMLPVHARPGISKNCLPKAYAFALAEATGNGVCLDIRKETKTSLTGATMAARFCEFPRFEGMIEYGERYVLVDDQISLGSTLGSLRRFVEQGGGEVVDILTLSASQGGTYLAVKPEMLRRLNAMPESRELLAFLRDEMFICGFDELTERQAWYLCKAKAARAVLENAAARKASLRMAAANTAKNQDKPSVIGALDFAAYKVAEFRRLWPSKTVGALYNDCVVFFGRDAAEAADKSPGRIIEAQGCGFAMAEDARTVLDDLKRGGLEPGLYCSDMFTRRVNMGAKLLVDMEKKWGVGRRLDGVLRAMDGFEVEGAPGTWLRLERTADGRRIDCGGFGEYAPCGRISNGANIALAATEAAQTEERLLRSKDASLGGRK